MHIVTLKVIAEKNGDRAIWSVDMQIDFGQSRLCGAWMNPSADDMNSILRDQPVLAATQIDPLDGLGCRLIDLPSTRQALVDEFERLVAINQASRTDKGNKRAPLIRPGIPGIPEPSHEPPLGFINTSPAAIAAINAAHYLAALADSWAKIETLRLGRDYLRGESTTPRQFPVVAA